MISSMRVPSWPRLSYTVKPMSYILWPPLAVQNKRDFRHAALEFAADTDRRAPLWEAPSLFYQKRINFPIYIYTHIHVHICVSRYYRYLISQWDLFFQSPCLSPEELTSKRTSIRSSYTPTAGGSGLLRADQLKKTIQQPCKTENLIFEVTINHLIHLQFQPFKIYMVKLPSNINILQPSKNSEATRSRQRCCGSRHNARNWWEKTWKRWIGRRQNGLRRYHGAEDVCDEQQEFYWMSKAGVHQRGTLHV